MSNQEIRLRLAVRRHGVPEVKLVWPCERSADLTIAKLVASVNEVVPLECSEWGLEDYAVELVGADGDSYECLHFQLVAQILKDEDQLIIRSLLTDDVRRRRISGRYQISADGKHLFDGVPFGRPRLRAPRDRPAIELPPRKRARIEAYEMEAGESEPEEMLMLDAPPEHHDDDDDDDENDDDDDWKPVQERHRTWDTHDLEHAYASISEHSDSDLGGGSYSREELDEELKALQDVELVDNKTRLGTIECSSEYLAAIGAAYPRVTLTAIEKELVKQKHNIRKTYDALQESTQPSMSFDEMMDGMVMGILDQSGSSPLQEQPVDVLLNRPSPPRRPLIEDVTSEGVLGSGSSEATSSDGDSTSDSGSDDEVEEDGNKNKAKDGDKNPSLPGKRVFSSKIALEDSSDDSSDDSFHDSGDESDSEAVKKDDEVASSSSSGVMSSGDDSGSDSSSEDDVKKISTRGKGKDSTEKLKSGGKVSNLDKKKISSSDSNSDDDSEDSSDESSCDSSDDSGPEPVKNPSSTQTQQDSAPSQGLSRTQKRNARRRKQKVMMRQETSTPNSMDAELLARKEALLGALQAHVTHDASQESPAKPESATSTPNGDRTAVANASAETSAQRRTRVDMGAGRRMLFGALGLKNPKTKADEERIKQGLMKDVKPLSNPRIVEVNDGEHTKQATEEDADPDAWRSKVTYRAVECCHEGMKLSEPPFPFVQRWDPQQQYGSMRKRKRQADEFDEEYYGPSPSNGNKSNTRDPFRGQANGRVETDSLPAETTNGQPATNGHIDQADNREEEEEEDLPPLPADLNTLPSLKRGSAKKGMVITWKQCTMSKATQWQPVMASITGEVLVPDTLDPPNSVLQVWLAFRDREYKEKLYDEKTGQRIYDKFEVPDFEDEDGEEEEEDDGLRMVGWEEMGDPRILAEVSPWGRAGE
ncbi:uncharacterized protein CPUR_05964 [Claviceps purpurea 20.1]|uniref:DUF7357 domain-containing protein n=1 Tax=Claviceps purpurea (strain 20.1) TaxID=1111077 RepID=M1W2S4_CLAP2|nr:hypothetical protein E4U37_002224 [Claviceps purpurea]KAG6215592.1 hypothetical protein E4U50_007246 [Claviceps purpurea]CCE32106.1 uncharacterized protein CPUR_05964 [Claviceps purpurea 20.1]